ncbi:putative metal-dependent hydrolase [Deinococcus seoulensis]|uniref:Putative metal-dependent hydrolase GCM10008959_06780 n=1 Tax=Deinococcus seoulensis TaxID=1837379 RepID=A0ABQ2RMT4_9DEIO|nr:putative metal-dependent hydrolase [Deinococcus seoulensis]GGR48396.1 putative metal-dependent hydrolase [Deinococcus seoulensis]
MTGDLRYPLGPMPTPQTLTPVERVEALGHLFALPADLFDAVQGLSDEQLSTPYRDGGWTVRQVVHHVAESHMNAFIRLKLALTEENPTIKPYEEDRWATLPDHELVPDVSLNLLDALHSRLGMLFASLDPAGYDWARPWTHPAQGRTYTVDTLLAMYAWHGRHHTAQITALRERNGW